MLADWLNENAEHFEHHPFSQIVPMLREMLSDGVIDDQERAELLQFCERVTTTDQRFDVATSDMQRLQGIIGGIAADGAVTESELRGLLNWMAPQRHLRTVWPFDEMQSLATSALADGVVNEENERTLVLYFNEFLSSVGGRAIDIPDSWEKLTIQGICSVAPEITFPDRKFSFTGKSERAPRKEIAEIVTKLGGVFLPRPTNDCSYLIIGAKGNTAWAYACYGRKVEKAVDVRRCGFPLLIVHENDFWTSVDDA